MWSDGIFDCFKILVFFCSLQKSGAFVYGFIGFFDKVVSGAIFAIIQELNPRKDQG